MWVSRRIGRTADYDLTLEEVEGLAAWVGVPLERIVRVWLESVRAARGGRYVDDPRYVDVPLPLEGDGPRWAVTA